MNNSEKYRMMAASLRDLAVAAEPRVQRDDALSLVATFERLAGEAEQEEQKELETLFARGQSAIG